MALGSCIPAFSQYAIWMYNWYISGIWTECSESMIIWVILMNTTRVSFSIVY